MRKFTGIFLIFFLQGALFAQDVEYAREVLDQLTSDKFYGRGYVKNGDAKAADYISKQFEKDKLEFFGNNYFQNYTFAVNTFPKKIEVSIDGQKLVPGIEFVISSSSPSVDQIFEICFIPEKINSADSLAMFIEANKSGQLFIFQNENFKKIYGTTISGIKAAVLLTETTPYWHVSNSGKVENTVWLKILKSSFPANAKKIEVKAKNEFISAYKTQNVVGFVKGKKYPDQFIVLSAHFDHLGMMGKTIYPGANDNASGTAMLLDLAKYYSKPENQPDRSIAFIAFSGEETGLNGSKYFAEHPLLPLEKIQMVINLDMVGTGSEGITVVNGELYPDVMRQFEKINSEKNFISEIKARGESCNSDHCPLYQKGVKSVFIYTRGSEHTAYHTPLDNSRDFPFTAYNGIFNLLTNYIQQFN